MSVLASSNGMIAAVRTGLQCHFPGRARLGSVTHGSHPVSHDAECNPSHIMSSEQDRGRRSNHQEDGRLDSQVLAFLASHTLDNGRVQESPVKEETGCLGSSHDRCQLCHKKRTWSGSR